MELMTAEQWAAQQLAGTWSELFDRTSFVNRSGFLTVVIWLAAFWLLGIIFMPLTSLVFRPLKDKGWGISKFFGLMVLGYTVWLAASLGMDYSRKTILLILGAYALLNAAVAVWKRDKLKKLREIKKDILIADAVFLVCFLFFLFIRFMNPDLWHPYKGGERPMDFSYFNAILKSTSFPPYDPWFAGESMNYYYYGIYLSGVMVKLLGVIPSVAFNLNLALWYAFLGSAAFTIGKTLAPYAGKVFDETRENLAGICTVIFMQVIGNLGTVVQIKNELIELGMSGTDLPKGIGAFFNGIAKLFSGERLPMYKGDWYWIPSRAIPDTSITEFPFFTFLYGDPHAHLFALPMTVLVLIWLCAMLLRVQKVRGRAPLAEWLAAFIGGALLIGTLIPTNTWDMPTYLGISAVVILYIGVRYGFRGGADGSKRRKWITAILVIVCFAVLSAVLFLPYLRTNSRENILRPWDETRTPIASFIMHWGVFLYFIAVWYGMEIYLWMKYTPYLLARDVFRKYRSWWLTGIAAAFGLLVLFAVDGVPVIWITLTLMVCSLLLLLRKNIPDLKRFVFFLIGTSMFAATLVEVIHLAGDVGRMNTVFKFYNQIWVMLAVSASFGLICTWKAIHQEGLNGTGVVLYRGAGILLVFCAFLYTVFAGTDKMTDRMSDVAPRTLDGMKYMETSSYWQDGFYMDLREDYDAIRWMQDNIQGSPVIVEASPTEYKFGSRYTVYTGLPGVVGWNYHQRQQRGPQSAEVWDRVNGIHDFYKTTDTAAASEFLENYNVRYIIVGQMEKGMYEGAGIAKFAAQDGVLWQTVYSSGNTQIYEVMGKAENDL